MRRQRYHRTDCNNQGSVGYGIEVESEILRTEAGEKKAERLIKLCSNRTDDERNG